MRVEVTEKEGLKRELAIEVPVEVVDEEFGKAYQKIRKKADIKGFRPGKAPVSIIKSKFKDQATADVVDELIARYYSEAVKEKGLEPVGNPTLSAIDIDEGKPLTFTLHIEVMPQVDSISFDNLKIEVPPPDVSDEEVNQALENMRKHYAELRSVERPATADDLLLCDLDKVADPDNILSESEFKNNEIDLSEPTTVPEFREGLAGMKAGEAKEVEVRYRDDYPDERLKGKTITYKVAVHEVKERILPPLNDQFAERLDMGKTLLELKLNLRKRIEADKKAEIERFKRQAVINQMTDINDFEVPQVMLDSYVKGAIKEYKEQFTDADEEEVREKYTPIGIRTIRWHLIYHRLAKQEHIEVLPADTENWIKRFADNYRMEVQKAKEVLARTGKVEEVKDSILEEKVLDFLLEKTEVTEKKSDSKEG